MRYSICLQHDERDCGAACLSMVATHYGLKYPISKYRELTKTDHIGTNLYGLCDAAQKIGFEAEALSGSVADLMNGIKSGEINLPFIAHIINEDGMQHFVVVFKINNNKLNVGDPGKGKIKYTMEQFAEIWTGYIVALEKTAEFKQGNFKKGGFTKFFSLLKGQYTRLISVTLLSLIISAIGIIGAFVFEIIIDDFYTSNEAVACEDDCGEDHEHIVEEVDAEENALDKFINFITDNASNFNAFFLGLMGLYILQALIHFLRGYLISFVSKNIDIKLLLPYYEHTVNLPISAINTRNTGEYLSRFSDASAVRDAISGTTLTLLLDSVMVIGCGVILFMENNILFYISLIIIVLYAIVVLCYRKPLEYINREVMENNARVQSYLKESIDGIETLKANRAEKSAEKKNNQKFNKFVKSVFKNNVISFSQESICNMIELVGVVIILWVGFGMVTTGKVTIGSLITFYALLAYFTEPIKNLISLQPQIQTAIIAAERLNDVLDISTEKYEHNETNSLNWNRIEFSNVDFRYGNHELTLKDISFSVEKGQKIAIVGESGCGKTTLAKLLLRFYEPENGKISIDNFDLKNQNLDYIRRNISYVDQNTFLFSDTIRNNLILGDESITENDILNACKITKADEFINEMPMGLDTFLDENGKNLSGGQKQRLAIVRALLRNPRLMIFDEATSNLDTITESAIKETIFNINDDMMWIIIAHRLNTIKNCDKIIVMEKGEIVEFGNHDELLSRKGRYFELYNRQ